MREHGEKIEVNFGYTFPINVCKKCEVEFIILRVLSNGNVWEQTGNKLGLLRCPYCGEKVGISE